MHHVRVCLCGALAVLQVTSPARAQRANENAVTEAQDAFGTTAGYQAIGLYSITDARGFNPQQAGNLRIEGLFFDMPGMYLNPCLVSTTTMHVGIAAQSDSFPAPTGIVDATLAKPAAEPGVSAVLGGGSYRQSDVLIEGRDRIAEHVSAFACGAFDGNFEPDQALHATNASFATVWRWQPAAHTEIRPFWSHMAGGSHQVLPQVYTDGFLPPPLFVSRHLASQEFTSQGWQTTEFGVILRQTFDAPWALSAGLFHASEHDRQTFDEEYLSIQPDGSADHVLDVVPALDAASTSGEVRLARMFGAGTHQRTVQLMVRGRRADRDFGGDALFDYGPVTLGSPPPSEPAVYRTSPVSVDETRQLDVGAQLEERWAGVGSIGLGLLRGDYRRTLLEPGQATSNTQAATPWLPSVRVRLEASSTVTVYASYLQGLEDSALAPSTALNHGELPPATRSRQTDGGVRYAPTATTAVIFGAFEIKKSYFNLDTSNVYTQLGTVRHRGLESSVTYADRGITLVAGGVLLKPHVERVLAEPGATGSVPIGPVPLVLDVNLDWAPPNWHPWAASVQWKRLSSRVATGDDRYWLPPLATLAAGVRYESKLRSHPVTVRLDGFNLTNARGLHLSELGLVMPELDRRFLINCALDY